VFDQRPGPTSGALAGPSSQLPVLSGFVWWAVIVDHGRDLPRSPGNQATRDRRAQVPRRRRSARSACGRRSHALQLRRVSANVSVNVVDNSGAAAIIGPVSGLGGGADRVRQRGLRQLARGRRAETPLMDTMTTRWGTNCSPRRERSSSPMRTRGRE